MYYLPWCSQHILSQVWQVFFPHLDSQIRVQHLTILAVMNHGSHEIVLQLTGKKRVKKHKRVNRSDIDKIASIIDHEQDVPKFIVGQKKISVQTVKTQTKTQCIWNKSACEFIDCLLCWQIALELFVTYTMGTNKHWVFQATKMWVYVHILTWWPQNIASMESLWPRV